MYFFIFRYVGGFWYDDGEFVHSEILNWEKSVCGGVWEGVSSTEDQVRRFALALTTHKYNPESTTAATSF